MGEDKTDKIRELEESLARELDQQINLSEPTDSRLAGTVELNPTIKKTPTPRPATVQEAPSETPLSGNPPLAEPVSRQSQAGDTTEMVEMSPASEPLPESEISLEDLDNLLVQESPQMAKELNSLRDAGTDISPNAPNLADYEIEEGAGLEESELPKKPSLFKRSRTLMASLANRTLDFLYIVPPKIFRLAISFIKNDLKGFVSNVLQKIGAFFSRVATVVRATTLQQKFMLSGLIAVVGTVLYLLLSRGPIFNIDRELFHPGFQKHSDEAVRFGNSPFLYLTESGMYPENVVLLDKVIVNLKPSSSSSRNPMIAVRLYFELTTQEAAVELKAREKDMRDHTQRVLEEFDYDSIVSQGGKIRFKDNLRKEISSILNNGLVKNVFIDDILIKP